jgi:hypothetical protein
MGTSSTNIAGTMSNINTQRKCKKRIIGTSFAYTSVITIEDDQSNNGMEFVMETPEKQDFQRKNVRER